MIYTSIVVALAAILICRQVFRAIASQASFSRAAREHKCERPNKYRHRAPLLGIDLFNNINNAMAQGNLMEMMGRNFVAYGKTFEATILGKTVIYTIDPQNIQAVTALEFDKFGVEPLRKAASSKWMGNGIFVTDGPVWDHARRTLKPVFQRAQISNFAPFEKHVSRMLKLIPRDGSMVDLQALFHRLFIDSSTEYLFGQSTNSLASSSRSIEAEGLIKSFDEALRGVSRRQLLGFAIKFIGRDREWEAAVADTHQRIDKYIDAALRRRTDTMETQSLESAAAPSYAFIDQLVYETQDRLFLRDQLLNVFFPARDSSAIGASCVFFVLARNPEAWKKLRKDVAEIDQPITFEVLKSMKYLTWVLNECLRLLSPTNKSIRTCLSDCVLPRGGGFKGDSPIFVRKGTQIDMDFGLMQKDEDLWGPDADSFRPERWENLKPMWKYIPFLGGPRICPAQQMILTQYGYLLVRFVQEFECIENRDEEIKFVEEHRMTKQSRNGVKVAFSAVSA